jgi:starvation-inducible DNA-binding protein
MGTRVYPNKMIDAPDISPTEKIRAGTPLWKRIESLARLTTREPKMSKSRTTNVVPSATPLTGQRAREIQAFGSVVAMPLALDKDTRRASAANLNQLLADTITLRDLYKKHHWQVSGPTFYQLHLLFDKHFNEQSELVDQIAERIMMLGGVSVAMSADVAEMTLVPRPPKGREEVPVQISRLLHAHEIVLKETRAMARQAADSGDDGTNDLLVSSVIRTNEMQVWFVAEHVVDGPLVHADGQA